MVSRIVGVYSLASYSSLLDIHSCWVGVWFTVHLLPIAWRILRLSRSLCAHAFFSFLFFCWAASAYHFYWVPVLPRHPPPVVPVIAFHACACLLAITNPQCLPSVTNETSGAAKPPFPRRNFFLVFGLFESLTRLAMFPLPINRKKRKKRRKKGKKKASYITSSRAGTSAGAGIGL